MAFYTTQLFIDDSTNATAGNPGWSYTGGWIQNGYSFPDNTTSDQTAQLTFSGIHLLVVGEGPASYDYILDDGPSTLATSNATNFYGSETALFNSSVLSDSNHTIVFGNFTGSFFLDYALIAPGPQTPVNTQTYIEVDDTDPALTYTGDWYETTGPSRHNTITSGSMIEFGFCGGYTTFQGTLDPTLSGNITLGISVDNKTQMQQVFGDSSVAIKKQYYYFWNTDLPQDPSNCQHLVQIELLSVTGGQAFSFGSFFYRPAFTVYGEAPSITVVPTPSSQASNSPASHSATSGSSKSDAGLVVGGVVGGLALLGIFLGIFLLLRKKRRGIAYQTLVDQETKPTPFMEAAPASSHSTKYHEGGFPPYSSYSRTAAAGPSSQSAFSMQHETGGSSLRQDEKGRTTLSYTPLDEQAGQSSTSHPHSTFETEQHIASSSSNDQSEHDQTARQMLEMMQSLQQRVDALQRPPAYDS